ncbi:MAG: AMP-dependent synthetase, partial [Clostridiales bacterium]|nr:AMP-dependent synthetase [Clostridiales bacterium]
AAKIVYNEEYIQEKYPNISEEALKDKIWADIKKINDKLTVYQCIKKLTITNQEMIKTTTQKVKRFEEIKKE